MSNVTADFTGEYPGIGCRYVNGKDTTYGQLGYKDDNSQDGDSTGNGDYEPAVGSVLKAAVPAASLRYQSYDQNGVATP